MRVSGELWKWEVEVVAVGLEWQPSGGRKYAGDEMWL